MRIDHIVHEGRGYAMMTPEELAAAGVPESVVAQHVAEARAAQRAAEVTREFGRRIAAVLGGSAKRSSMVQEAIYLTSLVVKGTALDAEQTADAALFHAINAWEGEMIEVRELLIASDDDVSTAPWPPAPAGVTAAWLAGF